MAVGEVRGLWRGVRAGAYTGSLFSSNVSVFCGIGGAFRRGLGEVIGVSGGLREHSGCVFVANTVEVELRSGRV